MIRHVNDGRPRDAGTGPQAVPVDGRHPVLIGLVSGGLSTFSAVEAFTGAAIRVVEADDEGGRLMVARTDPNGSTRSEWRSHSWVGRALADGHWTVSTT